MHGGHKMLPAEWIQHAMENARGNGRNVEINFVKKNEDDENSLISKKYEKSYSLKNNYPGRYTLMKMFQFLELIQEFFN